jgi:hypothetical protein
LNDQYDDHCNNLHRPALSSKRSGQVDPEVRLIKRATASTWSDH